MYSHLKLFFSLVNQIKKSDNVLQSFATTVSVKKISFNDSNYCHGIESNA